MRSLPHITVATVIEREGKFLMVRENSGGELVYNQPAGHVEAEETLLRAAIRETLEETAWEVRPTQLLGIYQYTAPGNGISYVRHCFIAEPIKERRDLELDRDIVEAVWLSPEEIRQRKLPLRSPLVMQAISDYLGGVGYPLSILAHARAN